MTFGTVESDMKQREKNFEEKHKRGGEMEIVCGNTDNFLSQIACVLNLLVPRQQQQPPARIFMHM